MFDIIHVIIYLLLAGALALSVILARKFRAGALNILFVSYAFGVFFLALSQLFDYLVGNGTYVLADVSFHLWLHLIMYCSLLAFIWGGYRVKKSIDSVQAASSSGLSGTDKTVFASLTILAGAFFVLPPILEPAFSVSLPGSAIDLFGLHHFLVFVGAFVVGWYLFRIKGSWGLLGQGIAFMVAFLVLIGGLHLWEVVTESQSLQLFDLPETIVEGVELFFLLPAVLAFIVGQWRIFKFVR